MPCLKNSDFFHPSSKDAGMAAKRILSVAEMGPKGSTLDPFHVVSWIDANISREDTDKDSFEAQATRPTKMMESLLGPWLLNWPTPPEITWLTECQDSQPSK